MNEEIKEILEEIDNKIIPNEHWNKVKDYITNLQQENKYLEHITNNLEDKNNRLEDIIHDTDIVLEQENERLKEELNYTVSQVQHNQIVTKLCKEKEDYKSRCEKAIEYIKNLSNKPNVFGHYGIDTECKKWLLNILNGSDNNE